MGAEPNFKGRDIISINDFSRAEIEYILDKTDGLRKLPEEERAQLMRGKVLASLFFEPSTRTRTSFNMAMQKLGGSVEGITGSEGTSLVKGESLADTIRMYNAYGFDVIVIRHPLKGSARLASEATSIPVINGGDGANQHPTQTLLDLYTIRECQGRIDGLKVAMVGDLLYGRTVHSLTQALSMFNGCQLYFVSPSELQMPILYKEDLGEKEVSFSEHRRIEDVVKEVDILYMTRIQKERFTDNPMLYEKLKRVYQLTPEMLDGARDNLRVLHPLPRIKNPSIKPDNEPVSEISSLVDNMPYAYYFRQAENGLYVRQALICLVTGAIK